MNKHELAEQKMAEHKKLMELCDKYFEEGDKVKGREYLILAARKLREGREIIKEAIDEDLQKLKRMIEEKEAEGEADEHK